MAKKKKLTPEQKRKKNIRLVVKANQLVEAKYMFDIWEMRIFLSLVASIMPSDEDDKTYRIWYKDVKQQFKVKSNKSYSLLRDAAIRLFEKSLVVGYLKDGHEREKRYHLIRGVDYLINDKPSKGGKKNIANQEYIDVKIDPEIKPYLLDIRKRFDPTKDRYTSYELRNVIYLQTYGIRIYELLKQYERIGHRTIAVETLKDYFNITEEYPRFTNFYQMVIKRSIKDINEKTDITIPLDKIEKIKKGRRVYALKFPIISKSPRELATLRGEPIQKSLFDVPIEEAEVIEERVQEQTAADVLYGEFEAVVVKSFGVTPSVFLNLLNAGKCTRAQITQAINVTRRAKFNQEIKKNVAGFFLRALTDGYTDPKEEARKAKAGKQNRVGELQRELLRLKDAFSDEINNRIRKITTENKGVTIKAIEAIESNPLTEALVRKKEQAMGRSLTLEDYRKDERLRSMVINNIIQMQQEQFSDILKAYNPKIEALEQELKGLLGNRK